MKGETEWRRLIRGIPGDRMYIVHCTLYIDLPFAKQPGRAEGLGSDAGAGAVFRRPSGLRGKRFPMFSAKRKKCTFAKILK